MKAFALAGLILTTIGFGLSSGAASYPVGLDGWHTIDGDGLFAFNLPANTKETKVLGDHWGYSRAYASKNIPYLSFNYGAGSCDPPKSNSAQPGDEDSMVDVKGRKARLTVHRSANRKGFVATICFPNVSVDRKRLSFFAICEGQDGVGVARQIFGTVVFPK